MNWKRIIRYLGMIIMIGVTSVIIIPADQYILYLFNKYAIQIMLFLMVLSVFFLIENEQILLFSALLCAGVIALYLKENTAFRIQMAPEKMLYSFSVAVIQLDRVPLEQERDFRKLLVNRNADIAVINNFTPVWKAYLLQAAEEQYSNTEWNQVDGHLGHGLFSRYPVKTSMGMSKNNQPFYKYRIDFPFLQREIELISKSFKEPGNTKELRSLKKELNSLITKIPSMGGLPQMITGDFELVSWNPVLSQFKKENNLLDSRRNFLAIRRNKQKLFQILISKDNLLYSDDLECSAFEDLYLDKKLIGFIADYQLSEL